MELVREIYRLTEAFPKREWYGLTAQMRRAAVSIPANIAEGRGRFTGKEYARFLTIATGSLRELDTYCELSMLLGYATAMQLESVSKLVDEIGAMLAGLCRALRSGSR
jgi:four helix bundle protein